MKYSTAIAFALSLTGVLAAPTATPNNGDNPSAQLCQCYDEQQKCSSAPYPAGNQAQCAADFSNCSGLQPYEGTGKTTTVSPTDFFNNLKKNCATKSPDNKPSDKECECNAAFNTCKTAPYPGGNQAYCASEFVKCSSVQPFDGSGKTTSVSVTDYFNNLDKNCPASTPPAPAAKPSEKECECNAAYNTCQTAPYPGGNQAQCAADFVKCSGVQPFDGSGKTTSVSATDYFNNLDKDCPASTTPAPPASSPPAGKPADTGYGSYGTYQNYPSHYASYKDYPASYASYGSYKKE